MSLLIRRGVAAHARRDPKSYKKGSTFVARSVSQTSHLANSRSDQEASFQRIPIPQSSTIDWHELASSRFTESKGTGWPLQGQRNYRIWVDESPLPEFSTLGPMKSDQPRPFQSRISPGGTDVLIKAMPQALNSSLALWRSQMNPSSTYRAISSLPFETVGLRPLVVSKSSGSSRNFATFPSSSDQARFAPERKPGGPEPNPKFYTTAKIPTPKSPQETGISGIISNFNPTSLANSAISMTTTFLKAFMSFLLKLPYNSYYYLSHADERRAKINEFVEMAKKEAHHYWMGSKLLVADIRTARSLVAQTLTGSTLTRRERKQLLRTVSDLFRLIPFSMFVLIPFMEFALPLALRLFPNMLPSTFQDSLKAEESMKRELKSRIAMAQFFQETLEELAKEQKRIAVTRMEENPDDAGGKITKGEGGSVVEIASKQKESAASMLVFLDRARRGEMMPPEVIIQYANFFKDDLTLDNMPRMQLINMCRYMSIPPYGADAFLRFQLRHRIRTLKEDDQRILWEGIDSLTKMELREACQERGMRSTGLSKDAYKRSLQQWLDLSVNKSVPISLLIMSRTFFLQDEMAAGADGDSKSVAGIVDAISGLDKEVLNEVILEVATSEEKKSDPDVRAIKLEVVTMQNERIRAEREAAAKKKESSDKEKESAEKAAEAPVAVEAAVEQIAVTNGSKSSVSVPSDIKPADEKVVAAALPDKKAVELDVEDGAEKESLSPKEMDALSQPSSSDQNLSTAEMEAIAQLVSADPVSKERAELERIKSAMQADPEQEQVKVKVTDGDVDVLPASGQPVVPVGEKGSAESSITKQTKDFSEEVVIKTDLAASTQIETMESKAAEEAAQSTTFTAESVTPGPIQETRADVENTKSEAESDDPIVARLKKRIASMVDKIEVQLSDVEVRIGDKLHFLDKDKDGILSREEMASCLQQVLKRKITLEEAMAIASEMDENKDGVFTVNELIRWIETNRLVKLEEEGRDADMDRIMESEDPPQQKAQ